MSSLKRMIMNWRAAEARQAEVRQRAAAARTGQVVRSTVDVGGEDVAVEDVLLGGVETAERATDLEDGVFVLDQDQADSVDRFLDGNGPDVEDLLGAEELADENTLNDVSRWDEQADAFAEVHAADMRVIEAQQELNETREELDGKLAGLAGDLSGAEARLGEAEGRLDASEAALGGLSSSVTEALNEAASAQLEASLAKGLLTVSASAPVAADGAGKPVGAVWMHRTGAAVTALFEWTALGWVPRPLAEQIIPKVAIGEGTYGELDGVRLRANTVAADRVLVGRADEVLAEPLFDRGGSGWLLSSGMGLVEGTGEQGGVALQFEGAGAAISANSVSWPVDGKTLYTITARLKVRHATTASNQINLYVRSSRAGGGFSYSVFNVPPLPADTWVTVSGQVESSDDAVAANVQISPRTPFPVGNALWVSSISARRRVSGELLVDGAVGARHVATGTFEAIAATITDAWIRNGHIIDLDVSKLVVTGSAALKEAVVEKLWAEVVKTKFLTVTEKLITKDVIATGAIDGMTITGALIRTAATGQRMQFDNNGLRAFNSAGAVTASLAAASGGLEVKGPLVSRANTTGERVTVGDGALTIDNQSRVGSMTVSSDTISFLGAGRPFQIFHESAGSNSPMQFAASGNNTIDFLSTVTFSGDTDWVDISSDLTATYRGSLYARRKAGTVEILYAGGTGVTAPVGNTQMGTIRPAWRPTGPVNRRGAAFMAGGHSGALYISSASGAFGISQQTGASRSDPQGHIIFGDG